MNNEEGMENDAYNSEQPSTSGNSCQGHDDYAYGSYEDDVEQS